MDTQYTHELTLEMLAAVGSFPFTTEYFTGMHMAQGLMWHISLTAF